MIATIKKKFFKAKYPYFLYKDKLSNQNDLGLGRIVWCPSPGKFILFKKGDRDEHLNIAVGDQINIETNYYAPIDKLTLETEYVNQKNLYKANIHLNIS
jgi:hypothetical protein